MVPGTEYCVPGRSNGRAGGRAGAGRRAGVPQFGADQTDQTIRTAAAVKIRVRYPVGGQLGLIREYTG
eukprot:SAG11_NODE_341_length_10462_cov_49.272990_6_plen_68_part_00